MPIIKTRTFCPCRIIVPPLTTHLDKILARVFDAVAMSAPAIAMPFMLLSQPAGSPSVVMIAQGLLDNAIGYVIADKPFMLVKSPHCLLAKGHP